jgi:phosphoglycolate phosphatase
MKKKIVIFDFDGTIADSRNVLIKIFNRLAVEFNYDPLRQKDLLKLRNLSSREILLQSPLPAYKIPFFLRRVKKEFNKEISHLKPFSGINESLKDLREQNYKLGIITSNLLKNVQDFLVNNQLDFFFDFLYSEITLFGKDKIINKLARRHNFSVEEIIYIGDETRDIEAAKKSRVTAIAVSWGFNSPDILAKYNPDYLINHPQDLVPIILKA